MIKKTSLILKNIGTKSLIILISLSFAVWGLGDIFVNNKNPTIAQVGNSEIKLNEFNMEYQNILLRLRQSSSEPITEEFVKAMGLQNNIIQNLVNRKYIYLISKNLGIDVGDKYIKKSIFNDPLFKDQLGVFNKDYFNYYLNQYNLSEQELVKINKDLLINNLFLQALNVNNYAPQTITENIIKKRDTVRKAIIYEFDSSGILFKDKIDDEDVKKKYQEVKNTLLAPEKRSISIIKIDSMALSKEINIDEKKVRDFYDSNIDFYSSKETRTIYQPIFQSENEAKDFVQKINNGRDFFKTLKEINIEKEKILLKNVEKIDLPENIGKEVFSIKKGQITKIYKSAFGYKLLFVDNININSKKNFKDVKESIIKDFTKEELSNKLYNTANAIFERYLETKDLELSLKNTKVIRNDFQDVSLNKLNNIYDKVDIGINKDELSKYIFNLNIKELSDSIEDKKNDIYFIYLNKIKEEKIKPFKEAKNEVVDIIYQEKRNKLAKIEAEKFLSLTKSNSHLNYKNKIFSSIETDWLSLDNRTEDKIDLQLKQIIFNNNLGQYSDVFKIDDAKFALVKTIKQNSSFFDKEKSTELKNVAVEYSQSINADVINSLLLDLKKKYKSKINEGFLKSF